MKSSKRVKGEESESDECAGLTPSQDNQLSSGLEHEAHSNANGSNKRFDFRERRKILPNKKLDDFYCDGEEEPSEDEEQVLEAQQTPTSMPSKYQNDRI